MGFDYFDAADTLGGLSVLHAEFVAVCADGSDLALYEPIVPVLQRVRRALGLDVVFVSQFLAGWPVVRETRLLAGAGVGCDPAEVEYAHMLLDARAGATATPGQPPRRFMVPVVSKDGRRYGTLCCTAGLRRSGASYTELEALRSVARVIALALSRGDQPDTEGVWESSAAAPLGLA